MEGGALQAMMALHLGIVAGEDGAAAGVGDGEKAKALSAIAALVQNFAPAEREFLAADGATLLRDALALCRPARLRARAAFFLQWLLRDSPPARAAALAAHAVPNLALASADAANGLHAGPSPLPRTPFRAPPPAHRPPTASPPPRARSGRRGTRSSGARGAMRARRGRRQGRAARGARPIPP
jgi:hypothetical protein